MDSSTVTPTSSPKHTNSSLYSLWAPTYDSDGNILQAVDNLQLDQNLLPHLVSAIEEQQLATNTTTTTDQPLHILDLGCGTGRTTLKLASLFQQQSPPTSTKKPTIRISAWDSSPEMLSVARTKLQPHPAIEFSQIDLLSSPPSIPKDSLGLYAGITSTLVLEHLPLQFYFSTVASLLAPGGVAIVTNMHPEMGAGSVAGFKDESSGVRLKGDSYLHGVGESVRAAEEAGLRVLGEVGEVVVSERLFEGLLREGSVRETGRKWVGRKLWFGMVLGKEGGLRG